MFNLPATVVDLLCHTKARTDVIAVGCNDCEAGQGRSCNVTSHVNIRSAARLRKLSSAHFNWRYLVQLSYTKWSMASAITEKYVDG